VLTHLRSPPSLDGSAWIYRGSSPVPSSIPGASVSAKLCSAVTGPP